MVVDSGIVPTGEQDIAESSTSNLSSRSTTQSNLISTPSSNPLAGPSASAWWGTTILNTTKASFFAATTTSPDYDPMPMLRKLSADSSSTPPLESLTPRHRSTALASPSATDSPARKLKRESFDEDDILAKAEIQLSLLENFGIYIDINEERRRSSTTTANLELEGDNGFEEIELEDDERRERKGGDEEEEEGAIPRTPDLDPDDIDGSSRSSSIISYPSSSSSTTTPTSASPNIHIVSSSPVLYTPSFPPIVQRIETIEKEVLVQQSSEVAQSVGKGRGGATRKKKRASAANSTPTSPKSPSVEVLPIIGTVEWNPVAVGGEGDLTGVN